MVLFRKSNVWQLWISDNLEALLLYSKWQTRNEVDAQDLLQSVLASTWKEFKKKNPEDIYALVCRKIRNKAIDLYRHKESLAKREQKYGELIVMQSVADQNESQWFGSFVEAKESQRLVLTALHELDSKLQEIVILHIWNELSFRDIAIVTSLSKSTVAEKYKKAVTQLKEQLKTIDEVCNF